MTGLTNCQQMLSVHDSVHVAPHVRISWWISNHCPFHPPADQTARDGRPLLISRASHEALGFLSGDEVSAWPVRCKKVKSSIVAAQSTTDLCNSTSTVWESHAKLQAKVSSTTAGSSPCSLSRREITSPVTEEIQAIHPAHVMIPRHGEDPQLLPIHPEEVPSCEFGWNDSPADRHSALSA